MALKKMTPWYRGLPKLKEVFVILGCTREEHDELEEKVAELAKKYGGGRHVLPDDSGPGKRGFPISLFAEVLIPAPRLEAFLRKVKATWPERFDRTVIAN